MKKYITERGFLTEDGKALINKFCSEINEILDIASTESELRLVGSVLSSIVGNKVADHVQKLKK